MGWQKVGDLSQLSPEREQFKLAVAQAYPEKKPGAIPVDGGQLFRFVHEMQVGEYVAYPCKTDRKIHLGEISGVYEYNPKRDGRYPHQRSVTWRKVVPRTVFSQSALYEIGSAMTLFQIKNYADEFISRLTGEPAVVPEDDPDSIGRIAADIEDNTRDYILKRLATELKGHPFALFVGHLLETMGYHVRVSQPGPDGGIDVIAHRDELGFEPPIIKVQVKSTEGSVGDPVVSALYGKVDASEYGLLIALGTFTKQASDFARSKSNLRLIDGQELVQLVLEHYHTFDAKYKGLLPLKRVYIPQPLEEQADG